MIPDGCQVLGWGLDADAIFWFASTIAQCVVALLAFGAFLAVWRLDSTSRANEPAIVDLWEKVKDAVYFHLADELPPEDLEGEERNKFCNEGSRTVWHRLRDRGVKIPHGFNVERPDTWAAHDNWRTTLKLADEILADREYIAPRLANGKGNLYHLEKRAEYVRPAVETISGLRRSLWRLTIWGLGTLALSLAVIPGVPALAACTFLGYASLVVLAAMTGCAVVAAGALGRAAFGEPEAWGSRRKRKFP